LWKVFLEIEAVKAQFAHDMCRFVEVFGPTAEYLRHHGAFRRCIEEVAEDALTATPQPLDVGELGEYYVRPSVETMHGAAWCIGDAIHWCQANNRLL
jgi:hypothetical protein